MQITPYDPGAQLRRDRGTPDDPRIVSQLASIQIGRDRQLRIATVRSVHAASVEFRTYLRDGRRGFRPAGPPLYVFAEQLPAVMAALVDAAAALGTPVLEPVHADA